MFLELFRVSSLKKNVIFVIILIYQSVGIRSGYRSYTVCDLVYRVSIYFPSEFDLCFYFITFCNSNITHVICHTHYTNVAALHNTDSSTHPVANLLLNNRISPMTNNNFTLNSHTAYNMTILTVTMCCLVLVHEVHIDGVVRNFFIELCMKMKQWLSVLLQTKNPGFSWGECMHPSNNTSTILICICLIESLTDQFVSDQGWFPNYFVRKLARFVQSVHNLFGMLCYMSETLISIKILRSCTKPKLIVF